MKKNVILFKISFALGLFLSIYSSGSAQSSDKVLQATQISTLEQMAIDYAKRSKESKEKAWAIADQRGWVKRVEKSNGEIIELVGLNPDGTPKYYITDSNVIAAQSISTNKLWSGGSLGLSLSGNGMVAAGGYGRLGEWDGGAVRTTHQEFNANNGSTVVQRDGAATLSDHATHVAGTMVAFGVDAQAKGMSFQAQLDAHDWNSDESEMALAASRGLLVSNHSYGSIAGWRQTGTTTWEWWGTPSLSQEEDAKFGYYDTQARDWDEIALNAPYYLICKSAGNDRGDGPSTAISHTVMPAGTSASIFRPADGGTDGYDCIANNGNAKNILTVGAVNDIAGGYSGTTSVTMSTFSGWGPTDDGRIKPDICANGVGLYSSYSGSNTQYASISGTSMATPNLSGSLLLLQQHYQNLFGTGNFMRAATLKGLVIHTADEAGSNPGPDYKFGWGLANMATAAQAITGAKNNNGSFVFEKNLTNSTSQTYSITSNGQPLRVTICWTDRPATPLTFTNDSPTRMLVNDLDIRINFDGNMTMPWILDPANPNNAATRGDNNRDNVEQILLSPATNGANYILTVSHKGTLVSGLQPFSIWISGASAVSETSALPTLQFTLNNIAISEGATTAITGCRKYQDVTATLQVSKAYTGTAQVTLQPTGTASGTDYTIITPAPITFSGSTSQNITIRVFDDTAVEPNETIELAYTLSGSFNIGQGTNNQTFTITINNDDADPTTNQTVSLLNEDWESDSFTTNGWTVNNLATSPNRIVIVTADGSKKAGYDYSSAAQSNYNQTITSKLLDATELSNLNLEYQLYWDNFDNSSLCYMEVEYSSQGSGLWTILGTSVNTTSFVTGDNTVKTNFTANLATLAGKKFQVRFRFYGATDYPIDLVLVDDIKITGTKATQIETALSSASAYVGPSSTTHFYSSNGKLMGTLENLSTFDFGCTTLQIDASGTGTTPFINTIPASHTTQKTWKITPTNVPTNNVFNRLTLYYTNTEITGWETGTSKSRSEMTIIGSPVAISSPNANAQYGASPVVSNILGNTAVSVRGTFTKLQVGYAGCVNNAGIGPLSLERNALSDIITLYPNPTHGNIKINTESHHISPKTIWKLLDANGKVVSTWVGDAEKAEKEINAQLSKSKKGLYVVHLQDGNAYFTGKIIKQ
jgi:hypothetical protein